MHWIASSILGFFLSPFNWVIILIAAGFVFRKLPAKKACRIIALCIFLIFGNKFLLNWYAKKWQPSPVTLSASNKYSCGIVLGGFASPDAEGHGYFNATSDRFIETEKLYKLGNVTHILISGGNGKDDDKDFREGLWVKQQFTDMGIPDSVIFVEDNSDNTADNAINTKNLLDSVKLKPPYVLITSAQHLPRASLLFKNAGIPAVDFPCGYTEGRGIFNLSDLVPKFSVLSDWSSYLKETAAYCFYYFKNKKN